MWYENGGEDQNEEDERVPNNIVCSVMLNIENLPNDVQALIWEYAVDIAAEQRDSFRRNGRPKTEWKRHMEERDNRNRLLRNVSRKAYDFCAYMDDVKRYETGRSKYQPWPYYKPKYRRCIACGNNAIHVTEPTWKTNCYECYRYCPFLGK